MRTISAAERALLRGISPDGGPEYAVHKRLAIGPAFGVEPSLLEAVLDTDPTISATWNITGEEIAATGTIVLALGTGTQRTSPLATGTLLGPPRNMTGRPGRRFRLETACVAKGTPRAAASNWRPVFQGRIDDVEVADGQVQLQCRDIMCDWIDRWIEHNPVSEGPGYGWWLGETTMLDTLRAIQVLIFGDLADEPENVFVRLGGDPAFFVHGYWQQPMSGAQAILAVCQQRGYAFHARYVGDSPLATYYDPTYDPAEVGQPTDTQEVRERITTRIRESRREVRNRHFLQWGPTRGFSFLINGESVSFYGPRYHLLPEDVPSPIDTQAEADRFLQHADTQLASPGLTGAIERFYFWPVELADQHLLAPNGTSFDEPQTLRVAGYQHTLTSQQMRTRIDYERVPRAARRRLQWRRLDAQVFVRTGPPVGVAPDHSRWIQMPDLQTPT